MTVLVLTRKPGEQITIGDNITVTFLEFNRGQARIGIDAPRDVLVLRSELSPHTKPSGEGNGK